MFRYTGLIGAALLCRLAIAQSDTPTIIQPGAPGQPGKMISSAVFALPPPAKEDIEFMQAMIVHHSQAVDMVALLRKRGANSALQTLGERIALSQADEIESMKQWLRERRQSVEMGAMMHHHTPGMDMSKMAAGDVAVMPGMLSPNQMKVLAKASGRAFDTLFLTGMIQHHSGAVDMVDDLFAAGAGQDNVLFDFATDIDNSQRAEIRIMQGMLTKMARPKDKK